MATPLRPVTATRSGLKKSPGFQPASLGRLPAARLEDVGGEVGVIELRDHGPRRAASAVATSPSDRPFGSSVLGW